MVYLSPVALLHTTYLHTPVSMYVTLIEIIQRERDRERDRERG